MKLRGITILLACLVPLAVLPRREAEAAERVFKVGTGELADVPANQEIHVILGPHFKPPARANPMGLKAGGKVVDWNLGEPTWGRHVNGVVATADFEKDTFTVYTTKEIDDAHNKLKGLIKESNDEAKKYADTTVANRVVETLNKVVKDALPKEAVVELKKALKAELREELRRELKEELRKEIVAGLLEDRAFRENLLKMISEPK